MKRTITSVPAPAVDRAAPPEPRIRPARENDVPALERLIEAAALGLQGHDYDERVLLSALRNGLLAVDTQLIADGAYFIAEIEGRIVGAGGWSRRRKTINGAGGPSGPEDLLDPAAEAAKIRAFYVHPQSARLGIGSRLLRASEEAAQQAGFRRLELISTLTGAPLYAARGWRAHERLEIPLPDGQVYPAIRMTKIQGDPSDRPLVA